MKIHQRILLFVWVLLFALLPIGAATYKGTITLKVGETTRVNIGSGYMGTEIITSGYWDKSNSTFIIESVSGMYHKECTIKGNSVGTGKLYWDGYIFGDSWSFYWDVIVTPEEDSQQGSSDIHYEYDYGKWGDITIKYGGTKTLYHQFPSSVMNNRVNWEWCIREGANAAHLQEDVAVKITSQSVNSCTIKGVGLQLYEPTRLYYYVQTGTYNGSKVYAVGYYDIIVDYAGKVTTSSNRSSGTYEEGTKVYLTPSVSGGEIFYSTDGSDPTWASTFYTQEGITLSKSMTLKARSYAYGYSSEVSSWTYTVTKTGIEINATNFPDDSFRSWLLSQSYGADGKLTESEINSITKIDVSGSSSSPGTIKSLKGIEYFTALKYLYCSYNQLIALEVSKNTALTYLFCSNNLLTSLDVSKNTTLTTLSCNNNQLTSLNVSKNTALADLSCRENQLTALNVSKNVALKYLYCYGNQLTALDVSKNTALTKLYCNNNQLTALDVSNLTALAELSCRENQLTALNVSKNVALKYLYCYSNQLTALDVSKNTALTKLYCYNNQLTALDVSNLTALAELYCDKNPLTILDVSRLTALTWLSCANNNLTTLDISKNTALETLYCENNQLTTLDVSKNSALTFLSCYKNGIKGTAMDNLISSLPQNNTGEVHRFRVVGQDIANEGNICTTAQVAAVKAKGWIPCYYNSTTKEYVEYEGSEDTPTIKGDVNGDGYVNGTDLVALTNIILGKSSKTDAADVNGDGYVNGTDYVSLVNIVLGRGNVKAMAKGAIQAAVTTGLSIESFDIKAGETKEMVIDLKNPDDEITLVQFDLRLPEGLTVKQTGGEYVYDIAGRTTWRKHSLDANATNGIIRFLLTSSSNATLTGTEGDIITMTLNADNSFTGGAVKLENILLVTPEEKEIKQSDVSYTIGTTGIETIAADSIEKDASIFSLSGQRLDKPRKGINIIGGKKVVVK